MANTNSYTENMAILTDSAKEVMKYAEAMNEAVLGNDAEVVMGEDVIMPSFENVINRVERAERTISRFTAGKGVIETDDGTYRKVRVETISRPANDITNLGKIDTFSIDPNWFFESLQYPRCDVKIDLAGKIEPDSDRVYVSRIIVPTNQRKFTDNVKTDLLSSTLKYGDMIEYLESKFVEYKEDTDEVKLPLTYEKFNGSFQVTAINLVKNEENGLNYTWYYLSTLNYANVNENGVTEDVGHMIQVGDLLRYNNTLFKVVAVNQNENRVRLEYNVGYDTVGLYDTLELYTDPFSEKVISIGIGIDELNIIYIKGVNEKFNLLSREWSNPIVFITNDLVYDKDDTVDFRKYYVQNVSDFGNMWISQVKEGRMPAYGGKTPNAPTLNVDDLRVVQINTQLNATLDTKRYNQLTSEIASIKSNISATRQSISNSKNQLIEETDNDRRDIIQNSINIDTTKLNNMSTQFSSLVEELNTLLTEAGAINYTPKYHVRGFFTIPEPQYTIDNGTEKIGEQAIIGFEIMYRYLKRDNTGSRLQTFDITKLESESYSTVSERSDDSEDTSGENSGDSEKRSSQENSIYEETSGKNDRVIVQSVVFSDWNVIHSQFLEKVYNQRKDIFEWKAEKNDGTHVTINQIDIPIRSGEKVQIKVRSVSEAGYPYSPLKSKWSNSVIIGFPENLTTDDSVTAILDSVKSDMNSVVLQETLSAAGMYSHISDMNSKYKHSAENIQYTESTSEGITETKSIAQKIRDIHVILETNGLFNGSFERRLEEIEESIQSLNETATMVRNHDQAIDSLNDQMIQVTHDTQDIGEMQAKLDDLDNRVYHLEHPRP